jgi:outer membrane receptor protein involved in Fe transport
MFERLQPRRRSAACATASAAALTIALAAGPAHARPGEPAPPQAPAGPPAPSQDHTQDQTQAQAISLPEGPLDAALVSLAAQTHQQLLYPPALAQGRRVAALSGRFTLEGALARLLGPDVEIRRAGPNVVVLRPRAATGAPAPAVQSTAGAVPRPFGGEAAADAPVATAQDAPQAAAPAELEAITVIGTHIRGVTDTPSPTLVLDRRALQATGQTTLSAALAALPQNFAGSATEATVRLGTDRALTNDALATGVNLRGLGANATLVLVNGRRMAGTGSKGDFADVSAIPTAAVERVEILLDGASALYGSDAVGGVVNIVLRKRFDGAETELSAGVGTAGDPAEGRFAQSVGLHWAGGSGIVSYELYRRDALPTSAREVTADADLRRLGGTDHRQVYAHPGNLLVFDPVTRANVPGWAIPAGQDGVGLQPSDLIAGQVNLQNQNARIDVLPRQTRQSLYLAGRQAAGERLELEADARYSYRRVESQSGSDIALLVVTPDNPFFVAPNGAGFDQIAYSFADELPPIRTNGSSESLGVSFGGDLRLGGSWAATGYLAFAQEIGETRVSGLLNSSAVDEALGASPDDPATPYRAARDGYFNPFGGLPGVNSRAVLAFVGSGSGNSRNRDRTSTINLQADGDLVALPGGPLRLALGAQARREAFFTTSTSLLSGVAPLRGATIDAERTVLASFGELRAPLVGEANRRPGVERLELSIAVRHERYDDFGDTTNPKLGVLWTPVRDLLIRASYGRSFRAPALRELRDPQQYAPTLLRDAANARVLTLYESGGNPDLKPETATSWSAGADFTPQSLPGLRLSLTWFRTDFRDRIDQPGAENIVAALKDPAVAAFVTRLDPAGNPADRARLQALIDSPNFFAGSGVFPATSYGALLDARYVNTAALRVSGVDLVGDYATDWADGRLTVSGNASYLIEYRQQLTPTALAQDRAGVTTYPVKLRARFGADWSRGPFGANIAVNYIDRSRDLAGLKVDAQATADLQLRLEPSDGRLKGLRATLAIRNLFDSAPPFYDNPAAVGYDPANGDLIGRFVSLQLTRAW